VSVSAADIEAVLRAELAPVALDVVDDSHLHVGHAGAREGRHFSVAITSARFQGLSPVARFRTDPSRTCRPERGTCGCVAWL